MDQLLDERDITRLLAQYCQFCDDGRFDELVDCFTPDAEFLYGSQAATGTAALRDFFVAAQPPERRGKHITTNVVVEVEGDSATASSDFVFFARAGNELVVRVVGRYRDELLRDAGTWRIQRREAVPL